MGTLNALKNYERLDALFLNQSSKRLIGDESVAGEQVIIAAIDGTMGVSDVDQHGRTIAGTKVKQRRASLFMTERHAILYQARGSFMSDYGIAIPYSRLRIIGYKVERNGRDKAVCRIAFVPQAGMTNVPQVSFTADVADIFAYDGIVKTLTSASTLSGVGLHDESDYNELRALGLSPLQPRQGKVRRTKQTMPQRQR